MYLFVNLSIYHGKKYTGAKNDSLPNPMMYQEQNEMY